MKTIKIIFLFSIEDYAKEAEELSIQIDDMYSTFNHETRTPIVKELYRRTINLHKRLHQVYNNQDRALRICSTIRDISLLSGNYPLTIKNPENCPWHRRDTNPVLSEPNSDEE